MKQVKVMESDEPVRVIPSEHNEQATFFDYVLNAYVRVYPEVHPLLFSVPNGSVLAGDAKRRAQQMNKLKREGLTPGVADVMFLSGHGGYLGLVLEFKAVDRKNEKNGGVSESQSEFITAARQEGFRAEVVYGADHAIQVFEEYIQLPKTQELVYRALKAIELEDHDLARTILNEVVLKW
ncbi:MAG TPA: hypothetical protein VIY48_07005 [Candidatus Paceibacterota bacterium]